MLTGSEVYFYELSSALAELKHDVTLFAPEVSDLFKKKCINSGVELVTNIDSSNFDVILMSHYPSVMSKLDSKTPIINIVHSEIYPLEVPYVSDRVTKYVGIRPTICDKLATEYKVPVEKIQLIPNPIDLDRFNTKGTEDHNYGLFVGSMGGLRIKAALHFAQFCKVNNLKSIYVGPENEQVPFFDEVQGPTNEVEKLFKNCTFSAGIIRGRTYYEAKLCGKKTVEYFVDGYGKIFDIQYEDEPSQLELMKLQDNFNKLNVAQRIIA